MSYTGLHWWVPWMHEMDKLAQDPFMKTRDFMLPAVGQARMHQTLGRWTKESNADIYTRVHASTVCSIWQETINRNDEATLEGTGKVPDDPQHPAYHQDDDARPDEDLDEASPLRQRWPID